MVSGLPQEQDLSSFIPYPLNDMKHVHLIAIILLGLLGSETLGSSVLAADGSGQPSLQLTTQTQKVLLEWFECEECTIAQLHAVVLLNKHESVPYLAVALSNGPPPSRVVNEGRRLKNRYPKLVRFKQSHPDAILIDERNYIQIYLDQFTIQYQLRAAIALGKIGGPLSEQALRQTLNMGAPELVQEEIARSLTQLSRH